MKHKAQESLDALCVHAMVYEEDYDYEENECGEYKNVDSEELEAMTKPLQNLIDCQLTEEEINWIVTKAKFVKNVSVYTEIQTLCKSICEKLEKQKEMW